MLRYVRSRSRSRRRSDDSSESSFDSISSPTTAQLLAAAADTPRAPALTPADRRHQLVHASCSVPAAGAAAVYHVADSDQTAAASALPIQTSETRVQWGSDTDPHQSPETRHVTTSPSDVDQQRMTSFGDVIAGRESSELVRVKQGAASCTTDNRAPPSAGAVAAHDAADSRETAVRDKRLRGGKMSVVDSSEKLLKEFEAIKKLKLFTRTGSQQPSRKAPPAQSADTRAASTRPSQASDRRAGVVKECHVIAGASGSTPGRTRPTHSCSDVTQQRSTSTSDHGGRPPPAAAAAATPTRQSNTSSSRQLDKSSKHNTTAVGGAKSRTRPINGK